MKVYIRDVSVDTTGLSSCKIFSCDNMAISGAVLVVAVMVAFTATSGYGFTTIPGDLKQITASTNYFWGVNKNDDIFMCKRPCNGNWRKIGGKLIQVDADDDEVWGVNKHHQIYKRPVDGSGAWKGIGGRLRHVSASGNGYIWGTNSRDHIFKCAKPCNGKWQHIPGGLRQIDGGQERVYGVNSGGNVYTRNVDGSGSWRHIPGRRMKQITASGVHEVFAVDANKKLYRCRKPCLGEWEEMDGHFSQVEAGIHGVYGIKSGNDIMGKRFTLVP